LQSVPAIASATVDDDAEFGEIWTALSTPVLPQNYATPSSSVDAPAAISPHNPAAHSTWSYTHSTAYSPSASYPAVNHCPTPPVHRRTPQCTLLYPSSASSYSRSAYSNIVLLLSRSVHTTLAVHPTPITAKPSRSLRQLSRPLVPVSIFTLDIPVMFSFKSSRHIVDLYTVLGVSERRFAVVVFPSRAFRGFRVHISRACTIFGIFPVYRICYPPAECS
jgi:hypothetical protein